MSHTKPGSMTSRERVIAALEHNEPDRVPRDLGGTTATGINIVAYRKLIKLLDIEENPTLFSERVRLANLSETVLKRFKIDTRPVMPGGSFGVGRPIEDGKYVDGYGIIRSIPNEEGHWHVTKPPLDGDITIEDIKAASQHWPDPHDPVYTDGIAERARTLHEDTEYAVILNLPLGSIHISQFLRGYDTWLMDLILNPKLSRYLLDLLLERWLATAHDLLEAVGDQIDVVFFAEDIAFHNGPMCSPKIYKEAIQPYQKRIFDAIHAKSNAKILYHNCGSVTWHIPDLIEWGVDALNPVQVTSHDMGDTASLKERFGDHITFWGGVDTGYVLPQGTPEEVHQEVHHRIRDLSVCGGYILASVHNIQADVPPENVCALWDAADDLLVNSD